MAAVFADGTVQLWDGRGASLTATLRTNERTVGNVAVSPDARRVLTLSRLRPRSHSAALERP